jgi:hypothetical protein
LSPHEERDFFDAFDAAIAGDVLALARWLKDPAQGIQVYRNTIASGAIDALAATFATVRLMVGEEWFRAAAREFTRAHPPVDPALISYGFEFPQWLADFPPAADTFYLAGAARLDWLWWQSWSAGDGPLLDAGSLSALPLETLDRIGLSLHPTLRLAAFETGIPSLWLAHQSPQRGEAYQLGDMPERILFVRTGPHVQSHLVDAATFAFLEALQRHDSIVAAAEHAIAADPACSLPHILTGGIALGLFSTLTPTLDKPA